MRATNSHHLVSRWPKAGGILAASLLGLSMLGGPASAANSRNFTVTVSNPTPVSQGAVTKFDVTVDSDDNQTIANVVLSVPAVGQSWPAGIAITTVFGPNASMCVPSNGTSLTCNFGNIAGFGVRRISILAAVGGSVPPGNSITFSASAETNNENGSNRQVVPGTSGPLQVLAFNANAISTFNLGGQAATSPLGEAGAGNLQTKLNLLQNNGGNGNAIGISETSSPTQPSYCVALNLTCQPDSVSVTVNAGAAVVPYLETTITARVPKNYSLKKAFVIHVLDNGSVDAGFPLFHSSATSCAAHPNLVPCADFSLTKHGVLTVVVHTLGNGAFGY